MDEPSINVEPGPTIRVRGARVHNLRNLDVDLPRDKLVVLTGVSGSGKSSLAFDTIHAEGQRRYIEGLSSYARQFLDQLEPPDVDVLDGLPPTVSIDQKSGSASPRSTVGTLTEIHDYLRLLYARAGLPHCPKCGQPIRRQTPEQMVAGVMTLGEGTKVIVLAPLVRGRKGQHLEAFATIRREGLLRARVDGQTLEIAEEPPKLAKTKVHSIDAVIDRLVVRDGMRARLAESLDRALKLGDGTVILAEQAADGSWQDRILSVKFACPDCGIGLEEVEPRTFSFNSPHGACPTCGGLGSLREFDPDLLFPDRSKPVDEAVAAELSGAKSWIKATVKAGHFDAKKALASWTPTEWARFYDGDPQRPGFRSWLDQQLVNAKTDRQKASFDAFRIDVPCSTCGGSRLRPEARVVTVGGKAIQEVVHLPASEALAFFEGLTFPSDLERVGPPLVREIAGRLGFLERVGLPYLSLDRGADTLSGGELQRVRLASQIGAGLVGVCYVLDEPTSGLHPRDTGRLIASLKALRDAGNTVLVVEHDEPTIRAADWIVDLGPGAGPDGGRIIAQGHPADLDAAGGSITARFLKDGDKSPIPPSGRLARSPGAIEIQGASAHNLKSVDVRIPLGCVTCVTGVSGSGKSSLVQDILGRAARRHLGFGGPRPGTYVSLRGLHAIQTLVDVDQTPIGRTPRSTPATFVGVFGEIRSLYAKTREAKIRGYKANRFSFNVKGGRCEVCAGQGVRKIEMQFLPDLFVTCEACGGKRFNRPTLDVRYKGKSIGDALQLRVDEAVEFFDAVPKIKRGLESLHEAGLGYVTLGQSSTTLSGGEAQRVKLAAGLNRATTSGGLYILDEPTTGLHFSDVANLLRVLSRLADLGNTLVVIEHHLDVVRSSDWVLDLGPDGGPLGGHLVAMGTPQEIARNPASITGRFLSSGVAHTS
ncbi:MAG: excinuclease subunit [Planctomycetota bacterium]|nr:excinuclease subunit [Planctomycetota bacterium]